LSNSYDLKFENVPGAYFAQEIRLSIWQKTTTSSLFYYEIDYKDGSNEQGIADFDPIIID
jgi:hypothetical protein